MDELLEQLLEEIRVSECSIHGEYRPENIFELNPICPRCAVEILKEGETKNE